MSSNVVLVRHADGSIDTFDKFEFVFRLNPIRPTLKAKRNPIQIGTTFSSGTVVQNLLSFVEKHGKNHSRTVALINELRKTQHFLIGIHYG